MQSGKETAKKTKDVPIIIEPTVLESDSRPTKRMKLNAESCGSGSGGTNAGDPAKEELISRLVAARATAVFDPVSSKMSDMPTVDKEKLDVDGLMMFGYMELRMIIEWAKQVPGFRSLAVENQMALLKSSFMELNILRLSYRSIGFPGSLNFATGVVLPRFECPKIGWNLELIDSNLEFIGRLRDVAIDEIEFSILNAVVLASPDAVGIVDRDIVTSFQNEMLDCLEYYCSTRYPSTPRRYGKILLRLPALRTISARAAENFLNLSLQGQVKMNALVAEMMS